MKPLIILDRDGVINEDRDNYVCTLDQWIPIAGSIDAIARLSQTGWQVFVATNQSGIGRGYYSKATLYSMNERLRELVYTAGGFLEGIVWCPHTPEDHCWCRKPLPGMLDTISAMSGQKLNGQILVGDSLRDLEAALKRDMTPFLVRTGKGQKTEQQLKHQPEIDNKVAIFPDLAAVAQHLLGS